MIILPPLYWQKIEITYCLKVSSTNINGENLKSFKSYLHFWNTRLVFFNWIAWIAVWMSWLILWLSFRLSPWVNRYTLCWGLNFLYNWQFCSWLFRYTRGWIGTRAMQCSNCSNFVFSFSGTLAWFSTRLIPIVFLPVSCFLFVCPGVAFCARCCKSFYSVRTFLLWASAVLFRRQFRK